MRFCGSEENQRLERLLQDNLAREMRLWRAPVLHGGCIQGSDIAPNVYREIITWLQEMSGMFKFCSETFALGVCVLNRLLATVKAQSKYLKCMAITSLILAAKINEEDEVTASVKDLLAQSGCSFSTAEILRMERIILDKLHWDLYTATPIDFIHIFRALLVSTHPHLALVAAQKKPCLQASLWTRQVQHCMACHQLWQFKGSTLALAIITLELEKLTPDWFSFFSDLLKKAQVKSAEFICCKEMVDEYLASLEPSSPPNALYVLDTTHLKLRACEEARGDASLSWEVDDFCDGFGNLYNEVPPLEVGLEDVGGPLQNKVIPCPPFQHLLNE
uniref:Cyclin-like domain-containing protein n=1 Tax=Electrophorus electricus TaxID=8005 RepID=A0A4W4H168_ELEEL